MKRKFFVAQVLLTDEERQFIRKMQAVYEFYIIIDENKQEEKTSFLLQSDKMKDLVNNSFILGGLLSEIFRGRGLSGLPKIAEKHYFSKPEPEPQNPIQ